jgi:transglutaminase-like putative cysteine protease
MEISLINMRKLILPFISGILLFTVSSAFAHKVELNQEFKPKLVDGTGDLYIPLPQPGLPYQDVLKQDVTGNANSVKTESVPLEANKETSVQILHAHWDKVKDANLKVVQTMDLSDRIAPMRSSESTAYFLKPTKHVQTDGIVLANAKKITKGITDPDRKARAIYEWIVDNTFRNLDTRGCGLGDVKTALQSGNLRDKCADLNSLFVGLARASGVPAREVWGLRVLQSTWQKVLGKEGDVTKSQHCRAEYYSTNKKAWVAVDPADIRKLVLDGKMKLDDPDVKRMRKTLFGKWEGNWVAYNYGRDFTLPGQKDTLNYLMYPQLISGKTAQNGMDPSEITYTLTSKVIQ